MDSYLRIEHPLKCGCVLKQTFVFENEHPLGMLWIEQAAECLRPWCENREKQHQCVPKLEEWSNYAN